MHVLLRWLALLLVRVFFRRIEVAGAERIPTGVPVVFVANHPNGLLDPLVLRVAVGGPLPFLAKSTFFLNPFGRLAMRAFDALPAYRQQDGENTDRNEETFARCRQRLSAGGRLALFPEGTSHSDPAMRPLRTGAARIVLGAEAEHAFSLGLKVVPVGLFYEAKERFRSRVAVQVGDPVDVGPFGELHARDPRDAAQALTNATREALSKVVLEAGTSEIRDGLVAVAAWTDARAAKSLASREGRARQLAAAWAKLVVEDPALAESIARKARRLNRLLDLAGLGDPHAVNPTRLPLQLVRFLVVQVLLLPPAIIGAALGWIPYRVLDVVARRVKEADIVSTVKLIGGMALIGGWWILESIVAAVVFGWWAGPLLFVIAAVCGLAAVRFTERIELRHDLFRGTVLRAASARLAQAIELRRVELTEAVRQVETRPAGRDSA